MRNVPVARCALVDVVVGGVGVMKRPGAQRTIGDDVVEQVVIDTLETAPKDATHWSTRTMAAKHGISRRPGTLL